ncbi:aminoglycoside phosphotransferase family protein [Streptomyces sp. NBC_01264]|uniref:aminoglycoside phosphotransferase family protein n=1 Tax=Streptomyces sp. NBC_01264 TaxID=2903804 RepID=UPI00225C03DF|nr:aminoglycoside phosphotransferase family protein [Streptomyces sp. NBC_01264]MCX4783046.1 aminoglycoside phosphotransferase family protein [Streptomyces sp. NBC_01264]
MRRFAEAEDLSGVVRDALGGAVGTTGVERLRGGSKKGVYRVRLAGAGTPSVIVYSWADEENFWPGGAAGEGADGTDPFAPASGLEPFLAAQRLLHGLGARVPRLLLADGSRQRYAADVAVVEDVPGGTLEALFDTDPAAARKALANLARTLGLMHGSLAPRYGRVDLLERGGAALGSSCEQLVLDRALSDLDEAAGRDARIAAARGRLDDRLRTLRSLVAPRTEHGLIHGELGPDHVLVTEDGEAVLIEIEGLMYFDVEWEHVFLRLRFHERYGALARPGLDPRRLALYALAMRLSLVAGPLRLLDGDFPDREFMRGIAEHNLEEALALLP